MEAALKLPKLEKEDLRILQAIEIGMKRSEYVTLNNIRFYARYPMEETLYRLNKVHKLELIVRNSANYEVSYTLNSKGYDVLALHSLVEREVISQLGPSIGKGKESDVYSAMDDEENVYAVKIYRIGRTSFKNVKRLRDIVGERSHLSWLYVNRLAARREFEALKKIYELDLNTPEPIGYNRHIIVMEYLRGKELVHFKEISDPAFILDEIIDQVKTIYQEVGIIHGDLGEFNIVADEEGNILIIDWLQWVAKDHPNAESILYRDLQNICNYFYKKFKVECDVDEIMANFLEGNK
ncbi:MAG: RIO-type serine/threonine-protein kinase Rio2 [Promethearchaeota archaeon]|nr:MAG: RIO-type serine/threonine-protein kinase Rio2 [Candidatus Lokiarchaeota archaeon]